MVFDPTASKKLSGFIGSFDSNRPSVELIELLIKHVEYNERLSTSIKKD